MIERIPSTPPHIAPLPDGVDRPLWSVMIPVYNCSRYLEQCLNSVLCQDPGPEKMQIEVVDDHSTDADVGELVQRIGKGRVQYYRKEKNMGSVRNFESCINRSKGELIHILHGDDYVHKGFYAEIGRLFTSFPEAGAAFTDFYYVDQDGKNLYTDAKIAAKPGLLEDALALIVERQRIQPPAMVVRRSVYEKLGSFYAVRYGEDWEMWARIASQYRIAYSDDYLAYYRVHNNNITTESIITGQNVRDIAKVIDIIQTYLPEAKRSAAKRYAKKHFSVYFAWMAHKLYHDHKNMEAARKQINGAMQLHTNRTTLYLALKLYAKLLIRYKQ